MLFNKGTEYSIQILLFMSGLKLDDTFISAADIAEKIKLPKEFLSKILQSLAHIGIVQSQKGKNGGFKLNKPAKDIGLIDLINVFEDKSFFTTCILGLHSSCEGCGCPMHSDWEHVKMEIINTKISDLKKIGIKSDLLFLNR